MNIKDLQGIDTEMVVNKQLFEGIKEMVVCIICTGIIVDPLQCTSCENTFCKSCISNWMSKSPLCPFKCSSFIMKEGSRTIKNLLEKLILKCPYNCSNSDTFSYENLIKHFTSCEKYRVKCPSCDSFVSIICIKETSEMIKLKQDLRELHEENLKLHAKNSELEEELKILKDSKNNSVIIPFNASDCNSGGSKHKSLPFSFKERQSGLIDKCEHFKGNYKPIFVCCNKAFPCYLCHNKFENHPYEFSSKVLCLICKKIYTGNQCDSCLAYQTYKEK